MGTKYGTETIEFIETNLNTQKANPRVAFELAIILTKEKTLIGGCGSRLDKINKNTGNLGYIINPVYWGCGYATEATEGLIKYITHIFELETITATCDVLNIKPQKVLERCGLIQKELIKKDFEMKGRHRDTFVYELCVQ